MTILPKTSEEDEQESNNFLEEHVARIAIEVPKLIGDARSIIDRMIPHVRDMNNVDHLDFEIKRIEKLLESDLWSVHSRSLRAELLTCRHVINLQIAKLKQN